MTCMYKEELNNIKQQVIKAFVAHELGEELVFSDKVYDEKLALVMKEDPKFNIYEFQPNYENHEYVPHRSGMTDLVKEHIHDINNYWTAEEGKHKTPKWDGSSVVIYYTNGNFTRVVSMRDKDAGCDQTDKFQHFVPHTVDPCISYIRCECLVDIRLDENARGKANGLVNSKYLQEEIDEKASLLAFCAHDLDGNMIPFNEFKLLSSYNKFRPNGTPIFMRSPEVQELTLEKGVAMMLNSGIDFKFAVDGIVYYEDHFAYKYDFINSAITKVISVNWAETDREAWFPTVSVDPVDLDGAIIRNPSSNGVPKMIELGIGPGAVVEIIRSGLTIPKIVNTISPAEVEFPTCPHCDYKMNANDLYGSAVKCGNRECSGKYKLRKNWIKEWENGDPTGESGVKKYFTENIEEVFFSFLNVSRYNYLSKRLVPEEEAKSRMTELLKSDDYDKFEEWIGVAYGWTDLSWDEAWLNGPSTYNVIRSYLFE